MSWLCMFYGPQKVYVLADLFLRQQFLLRPIGYNDVDEFPTMLVWWCWSILSCGVNPFAVFHMPKTFGWSWEKLMQKGIAGAESPDPWRLEKQKKCIDKTFNLGTFLVHFNKWWLGILAKLGPRKGPQFFEHDFYCVYCGFSFGLISERVPNWWFWKWQSHVGDNSWNIFCKYWCEIGLILMKTRPTLFPMVQEYLRIIVR